ncbi:hypothetical protein KSP40_PGU005803 [Platanthera guangdongensis]|uniref:Uncharacterized protein n=1 Tax=Platanthera guangdongensis TaxID=2320717 RepID=A0ABR2MG14_9ASPA
MVLGCTCDHRVANAYSFNMFLLAWAGTAVGTPISPLPNFLRFLLSPRNPDHHQPSFDRLFIPASHLPLHNHQPSSETLNRIYYITAASILRLQNLTTKNEQGEDDDRGLHRLFMEAGRVGRQRIRPNDSHGSCGRRTAADRAGVGFLLRECVVNSLFFVSGGGDWDGG